MRTHDAGRETLRIRPYLTASASHLAGIPAPQTHPVFSVKMQYDQSVSHQPVLQTGAPTAYGSPIIGTVTLTPRRSASRRRRLTGSFH